MNQVENKSQSGLDELRMLNNYLSNLLNDPECGNFTWKMALSELLIKMAGYAGHGDIKAIIQEKNTKTLYVVGIPQTGGCWLSNEDIYNDLRDAEKRLKRDRENGIQYTKIFSLCTE